MSMQSESKTLEIVDRSTLERWMVCPQQAVQVEGGRLNLHSHPASVGTECHQAFSETIAEYLASDGAMTASDIQLHLTTLLENARTDVQPDALEAVRFSAWPWSRWLKSLHPAEIMVYDGGTNERSSQLSHEHDGYVMTAELDMLVAGASPQVVQLYDWKTGWKQWTCEDVKASFQFRFYAWLVLHNYPDVDVVQTMVWNAKYKGFTNHVPFQRRDMEGMDAHIANGLGQLRKWRGKDAAPCWPCVEKCRICPAAVTCTEAGREAEELAGNPGGFVDAMVALRAKLDAMTAAAKDYVKTHGEIVSEAGNCFGFDKPKQKRNPSAELY